MLKRVDSEEYLRVIGNKEIYYNPLFLRTVAKANNLDLEYFVFYQKEIGIVALALFVKNNKIILPSQYLFYSGIWVRNDLETKQSRDALVKSLLFLKEEYNRINLCLPLIFTDIRPFLWTDFNIRIRYTYKKVPKVREYEKDALSNYKKSLKLDLIFINNSENPVNWSIFENQLRSFGLQMSNINKMQQWVNSLHSMDMLFQFAVVKDDVVLGTALLLKDSINKKAYFLLRRISDSDIKKYVNSFFYIEILNFLSLEDYQSLDYLGANMRSIAEFKARYKPELKVNYIVSFKKRLIDFKKIKIRLRTLIVMFINYFNK